MRYGIIEQEVVSAAEAMPEDKYSSGPTNGEFKDVRTFAEEASSEVRAGILTSSVFLSVGSALLGWLFSLTRSFLPVEREHVVPGSLDAGPPPGSEECTALRRHPYRRLPILFLAVANGCEFEGAFCCP